MKRIYITLVISFLMISVSAQNHRDFDELGEQYQAQKVAFITNALELTPDESAAFWPLYNEHEKKKNELMNAMKSYRRDLIDQKTDLSEEQAREALVFFQENMNSVHQLEIEYQNKYLKVISARKVLSLMKAEKDFRRELLKKLGERRERRFKEK